LKQTDSEFAGWVFVFPVKQEIDEECKKRNAELWLAWLKQWNPPPEWKQ